MVVRIDDVTVGSVAIEVVPNVERLEAKFDGYLGALIKQTPKQGKHFGNCFFVLIFLL